MTPERWQQITGIFQSALAREPQERVAFLGQACEGDEALLQEVERLLASDEQAGSFINAPAFEVAAEMIVDERTQAMIGKIISHYKIIEPLGAGGMGEVYLAQDTSLGRKVALKLLTISSTKEQESVRRFQQEARAASALSHPHIAHIYEIGESDGTNFIAMEYVEGQSLTERIGGRPLEAVEIADIGLQVADALDEAHTRGIIHRDIKSSNIMLTMRGQVKVLDFGLAKLTQPSDTSAPDSEVATRVKTRPGVVMGTVNYMSPEQALGRETDARTDLFSLGVVLYEMATGRLPFTGESITETIDRITHAQPEAMARFNYNVPPELELIVKKALRKNRDERYQTARDLLFDLKNLKQELEMAAQLERTASPETNSQETKSLETNRAATSSSLAPQDSKSVSESSASTSEVANMHTASSAEYIVGEITRHRTGALIGAVALLVVIGAAAFGLLKFTGRSNQAAPPARPMKITALTSGGKVGSAYIDGEASISPDGKYVVYATGENGKTSLWLRQVSTSSLVQIVPPAAGAYLGTTFSRDGEFIYYVAAWRKNNLVAMLYRIPVLGGAPVKLLEDIDGPVTFSPDGKQLAYVRMLQGESDLMLANADGSGKRKLAVRQAPDKFSPDGPAWSPDGKVIACGAQTTSSNTPASVVEVSATDGTIRAITPQQWGWVSRLLWLSDGSGLIMTVFPELTSTGTQLWYLSHPSGESHRITNDLNGYGGVSLGLTADDSTILTVQEDSTAQIFITAPNEDESRARKITEGKYDGFSDLVWTPEGKVIYASQVGESEVISSMNMDGTENKPLLADNYAKQDPTITPDGRYIVFQYNRAVDWNLWRMDADGSNLKQLTAGKANDAFPTCSPDGQWVVFQSNRSGKTMIWKVSIDGGQPVQLSDEAAGRPAISPDGKLIAYEHNNEQANGQLQLRIMPFTGGQPIKIIDLPTSVFVSHLTTFVRGTGLKWTSDGRAVCYIDMNNYVANIWSQPIDGGKPSQLTNFKSLSILDFAFSNDGKHIACSRGTSTDDVVLIKDFR